MAWRRPGVQETGALRRAQPFVAIAHVEIRSDGVDTQWNLARRMRPVDQRRDAPRARLGAQLRHRQDGAVVEVMWLMKIMRVRGVTADIRRSTTRSRSNGSGISTRL